MAKIDQVFDTKNQQYITYNELISNLIEDGIIVLGEFHNDALIQQAQAQIIQTKTQQSANEKNVTLFWEFLDLDDQAKINLNFTFFMNGEITAEDFIKNTAGNTNLTYAPIFDSLKLVGGKIMGANLPRTIKQQVITSGIGSIDPKYVPYHHYNGDENYRELFVQAMGGHVPASQLEAYFTAQCLTDSFMADTITRNFTTRLNFLVAGSFHTDFYNGTVARIRKLTNRDIQTLKVVNLTQLNSQTIQEYKVGHQKYGPYADYIIMVK